MGVVPRLPYTRFLVSRGTLDTACLSLFSHTGLSPLWSAFPNTVLVTLSITYCSSNPAVHAPQFRLLPFRSPLLRKSMFLFFSSVLRMFQFGFPSIRYELAYGYLRFALAGFPIQKSPDQSDICSLPAFIAAYHVFHRLLVPRHPPYALTCLTITRIAFSYIPAAQIAFCAPWSRVFLGSSWFVFIG